MRRLTRTESLGPMGRRLSRLVRTGCGPLPAFFFAVLLSGAAAGQQAAVPGASGPQGAPELRNWFDDPFFQISSAIPDCPEPAGPFITEAERRAESHRRAEKGTTC